MPLSCEMLNSRLMNNVLGIGVVGIIIGLVLGAWAMPQVFPGMMGYMGYGGIYGAGMSANIDRHFIEEMIPHHEGAIAMAELALEKSKRPEILSLSQDIIEAQTTEINQMTAWYKVWFGTSVPAYSSGIMGGMSQGMGISMMGMEGDLAMLAAAKDFDLEFIRQMIPHHEMAVMMARMLAAGTERSEMQELADNIIASQSREIEMMQGWLAVW